jgi:RHS repeat-associated protein
VRSPRSGSTRRLRWADTDGARTRFRYDDLGAVTRIIHAEAVPGEDDEAPPRDPTCADVPADVQSNVTYYCYDEFERPRLSKGAGIDEVERLDYDGLDRRDTRKITAQGTTKTRDLSYIGTSELLSREVDDDGAERFYDYDSMGDRLGPQVTKGSDNRYRAYTKDVNDSVLGLESDDGQVLAGADYEYDPYGELENPGGLNTEAQENPFRFEGFYYDSGVKTYDMFARPYRPQIGRFLTQDRYASASQDLLLQSDPLTQNRYAFAGGNPVNNIEFDGHYKGNEGAAQRAMKGSKTPRGKRKATKAEEFIPGASKSAGIAPANFTPRPSGDAPLTDTTSTSAPHKTPLLAAPRKRPDSCPVPKTGLATGSLNACEQGPRNPRTQYDCRGNTQTPEGESTCAAWKLRDPAQINMSVQEMFGGAVVVRVAGRAAFAAGARLCKQWCEKVKGAASRVKNRLNPSAAKAGRGGAGPVRVGQAGEGAVRGAYDIGPKIKVDVAGRKRIPDGLTSTTLSEVKNVSSLSYSQQLRDFAQYAQQSGRSFDLYVRTTTRLSGPLQRAAGPGGPINLRFIP